MQTRSDPYSFSIYEGETPKFVARVEEPPGTPLVTADVTGFTAVVYWMSGASSASQVYAQGPMSAAVGFFDTLQFDGDASFLDDAGGYNFKFALDEDLFHMDGGSVYRVEIVVTTAGSGKAVLVWLVDVRPVLGQP